MSIVGNRHGVNMKTGLMLILMLMNILPGVIRAEEGQPEWVDVSESLFRIQYENYEKLKEQLNRSKWRYTSRTASLATDRFTGALYVFISQGPLYRSTDYGVNWEKLESAKVHGRAWMGGQVQTDLHRAGRLSVFCISELPLRKNPKIGYQTSGMSIDGGKSWISFTDPKTDGRKDKEGNLRNHDGWTYGQVDWSKDVPQTIIGKQHHSSHVWASKDGGKNWKMVHKSAKNVGLAGNEGLLVADEKKGGIYLSRDFGETWSKQSEAKVTSKMPVMFKGKLYWCTKTGLLTSDDQGSRWSLQGTKPGDISYGPYFGKDENEILVVGGNGFYLSKDAGKAWNTVAPFRIIEDAYNDGDPEKGWNYSFGWDWKKNILYAGCVGGSIHKLELAGQ
jgi:BNR/Asp-box repeat